MFLCVAVALLSGCSAPRGESVHAASAPAISEPGRIRLPADSPKMQRVRVAATELRSFPNDEVVAPGKVEMNPHRIARVAMPVAGRVRRVLVALGDMVAAGQPLLTVSSPEAGAAITAYRQAQAQARQAQSTLAKAQKDLARNKDLYQHSAVALKEVLNAEHDLAQAQAAVDQCQAATDDALQRIEILGLAPDRPQQELTVRAPLAGKVMDIAVVPGEYRNDTNAILLTIADLSSVWIAADVPETSIRQITLGESIQVELSAYPGEVFRGRVARIADTVDPQTRTIKVQAQIANPGGRLRPEMFGRIRHSHGSALRPAVPQGAVIAREGRSIVLMEESPGAFREVEVTPGAPVDGWVPILSGLDRNSRVVADGAMLLGQGH